MRCIARPWWRLRISRCPVYSRRKPNQQHNMYWKWNLSVSHNSNNNNNSRRVTLLHGLIHSISYHPLRDTIVAMSIHWVLTILMIHYPRWLILYIRLINALYVITFPPHPPRPEIIIANGIHLYHNSLVCIHIATSYSKLVPLSFIMYNNPISSFAPPTLTTFTHNKIAFHPSRHPSILYHLHHHHRNRIRHHQGNQTLIHLHGVYHHFQGYPPIGHRVDRKRLPFHHTLTHDWMPFIHHYNVLLVIKNSIERQMSSSTLQMNTTGKNLIDASFPVAHIPNTMLLVKDLSIIHYVLMIRIHQQKPLLLHHQQQHKGSLETCTFTAYKKKCNW